MIGYTVYAVEQAVETDNFEALETLLQNDPGNELRGLAVIHIAHTKSTVECLNRLLQNHQIPEADLDQAIDEASYYDIKEALEKYKNEKNDLNTTIGEVSTMRS